MKDQLLEIAGRQQGVNAKANIMREYLQAYILRIMHDHGAFRKTAFLGGTALRFLHNLPRFSEDLDFSNVSGKKYPFVELAKKIKNELILSGYDVSVSYNDNKTVYYAFFKFREILYNAGISPNKEQNLSIKIEIDTKPPKGGVLTTEIVNKYFPMSFLTYDVATLFAGKLNALLTRTYVKGRDYFDLAWYLSKWKTLSPNFAFLKNALKQMGWKKNYPVENNWKELIYRRIDSADWKKVNNDVKNLLENPSDMNIFNKENTLRLIED